MAREKLKSFKDLAKLIPAKPVEVKPVEKKKDQNVVAKLPVKTKPKPEIKRGILPRTVKSFNQDLSGVDMADVYKRGQHRNNVKTSGMSELYIFKNELQKNGLELFAGEVRVTDSVVTQLKGENVYDALTCELISKFQRQYDEQFRGK